MVRSSSYKRPYYRGSHSQNEEASQAENQEAFFGRRRDNPSPTRGSFFQTKLSVNQPGDSYEKEADHVADKVVSRKDVGPVVQQKEITGIQRLATPKEDEKLGTNDARMLRDKEIQEKPEVQRKCAECEKEEAVQRQATPEEEKEPIQREALPEEEEAAIQSKSEGSSTSSGPSLSTGIKNSAGKGSKLPQNTLSEMQGAFQTDFSNVTVHNDSESADMNKSLRAQAFTHGSDIYFNAGKYDPQSREGKRLLAHELTHVVQQGAVQRKEEGGVIQPYRDKKKRSFNYGTKDTPDLKEEAFNKKKDKETKPWLETIHIHFDEVMIDSQGDMMPKGFLFARYHLNDAAPFIPFFGLPITGGKHTEIYTHPDTHTVHRIEGVGYHNASEAGNEGPNNRYRPASQNFDSNMSFAVFFHRGEAIHRGALDVGSHGCVHVDWGGAHDDGDVEILRRLNYHSVIGLTKVIVTYKTSILPTLCCEHYKAKGKTKGTGDAPCDKTKAQSCP